MKQSTFPEKLASIWAKKPLDGETAGETLSQHTWFVLQRLSEHMKIRPYFPEALSFPRLWHCLFWACYLHDFGKSAKSFQMSLRHGKRWAHRHEVYSLLFLDWLESVCTIEEQHWIAAVILSHHKEPGWLFELYDLYDDDLLETFSREIQTEFAVETIECLWDWLAKSSESWLKELGLAAFDISLPDFRQKKSAVQHVLPNGSQRLSFWLHGYRKLTQNLKNESSRAKTFSLVVRGYMNMSDYAASAHAGNIIEASLPLAAQFLQSLAIKEDNLYEHQKRCLQTNNSAVLIAPTGSGKTEASLLWALTQKTTYGRPARLFYMLPYQASMNAMYDRLNRSGFKNRVGLEHGRSVLALYKRLLDEHDERHTAAFAAKWAKMLAKLNYYPVRILSPYQLLKALFRLKTYEQILCDYFNAVVIFDEIHAYEPEKLALFLGLARFLKLNFNTRFFIMSATFPALLEKKLAGCLGKLDKVTASSELFRQFKRHCIRLIDAEITDEVAVKTIVAAARKGKSILICCNTVKRAQNIYQMLQEEFLPSGSDGNETEILLLHGRYNMRDRLATEGKVNKYTGAHSANRQPVILVSTQVVEVSLDIDLDEIYTEAAPLEALIQRFGRINRRRRHKLADVFIFTQPGDGQGIYLDELVVKALEILTRNINKPIREDEVSEWLDTIYAGEAGLIWEKKFDQVYDNFLNANLPLLYGFNTNSGREKEFYKAFDSIEVLPVSLADEYHDLLEIDPLRASELLVPIRFGQLGRLKYREENRAIIVEAEYGELGLRL